MKATLSDLIWSNTTSFFMIWKGSVWRPCYQTKQNCIQIFDGHTRKVKMQSVWRPRSQTKCCFAPTLVCSHDLIWSDTIRMIRLQRCSRLLYSLMFVLPPDVLASLWPDTIRSDTTCWNSAQAKLHLLAKRNWSQIFDTHTRKGEMESVFEGIQVAPCPYVIETLFLF